MNTLRTILILVFFVVLINLEFLDGLQCYMCESNDWNINGSCEVVISTTPKVECTKKCWNYYTNKDHGLVRGCFSDDEIDTIKNSGVVSGTPRFCTSDLCNKEYQIAPEEGDPTGEFIEYEYCVRCSSTKENPHEECYTGTGSQNSDRCPKGRKCVIYYKSESEDIQRNCHVWSEIQKVINAPIEETWTIRWCSIPSCNGRDRGDGVTSFPGCKWYFMFNETAETDPPEETDGCVFRKLTQEETKLIDEVTDKGATGLENKGTTGEGCVFVTNILNIIFMFFLLTLLKSFIF